MRVPRHEQLELEALRAQIRRERAAYAELRAQTEALIGAIGQHRTRVAELLDAVERFRGGADVG